jgi:hypothetical protein
LRIQVVNRLEEGLRRGMSIARPINAQWLALVLIALNLAVVWIYGSHNNFVPCAQDCGETFVAQQSVVNFHLYGTKYWLLQDHSTIPDPDRHPFIYTHNVHFGALLFPLLDQIGISTFWAKQLFTLLGFGAGLAYVFLTIRLLTKSSLAALTVLVLFSFDYGEVFSFALNSLRAWHWLALFGLTFHGLKVVSERESQPINLFAISGFTLLAFGIGYEFLAIALGVMLFTAIFCARSGRQTIVCLGFVVGSVLLVFAVRQLQVIAVLGLDFWSTDFFYSAVIKVTSLATHFQIPSLSEIDAFYLAHNVLRPFAAVAPIDQVMLGIKQHLVGITLPSIGFGAPAGFSRVVGLGAAGGQRGRAAVGKSKRASRRIRARQGDSDRGGSNPRGVVGRFLVRIRQVSRFRPHARRRAWLDLQGT